MHNLALAHGELGDHQAKHDMLQEVLKKRREKFDADHPDTLTTMNNLALAHGKLGDHQAEHDMLQEVLKKTA